MPHFQYPGGRSFGTRESRVEKMVMGTGDAVKIELARWSTASGTPALSIPGATRTVTFTAPAKGGSGWQFTITAVAAGSVVLKAADKNGLVLAELEIFAGPIINHGTMEVDFIADTFRGADAKKKHEMMLLLDNDPDNLFNEHSGANVRQWGDLACGTVSKVGGMRLINAKTEYEDHKKTGGHIHLPIKKKGNLTRADVLYAPGVITNVTKAIQKNLTAGMPVLVSLAYSVPSMPLSGGFLMHTKSGAHTVLIVGCNKNADQFLYVDPWPGGSKLKYRGGPAGLTPFADPCLHLGIFVILKDPVRNIDTLRTHPDNQGPAEEFSGDNYLEVIFGPHK